MESIKNMFMRIATEEEKALVASWEDNISETDLFRQILESNKIDVWTKETLYGEMLNEYYQLWRKRKILEDICDLDLGKTESLTYRNRMQHRTEGVILLLCTMLFFAISGTVLSILPEVLSSANPSAHGFSIFLVIFSYVCFGLATTCSITTFKEFKKAKYDRSLEETIHEEKYLAGDKAYERLLFYKDEISRIAKFSTIMQAVFSETESKSPPD